MHVTLSGRKAFVYLTLLLAVTVTAGFWFSTGGVEAGSSSESSKGLVPKTVSNSERYKNFDIRSDKTDNSVNTVLEFRSEAGQSAVRVADVRDEFVRGESALRLSVPKLVVEYNSDLKAPELIAPDVKQGGAFLTGPSSSSRIETLRSFAKENSQLIGVEETQVDQLKVAADYTNPSGSLSYTHFSQEINGIPVFRGELKAGFTKDGRIVRAINNLAPGLDYGSLSLNFGEPFDAVRAAAKSIGYKLQEPDLNRNDASSDELKVVFGEGDWATTAEKMYFPIEAGVARPAWRVLIWQPVNAFYVVVDAETGTMLWRKNITQDQTQTATYDVYNNPNAFTQFAESPAPLTPGPINPGLGTQGTLLTRQSVTLIGNEGPNSFNNSGWISDGSNSTAGNNTIAGLDIDGINGVDAPVAGLNRVFSSSWNPPPGNPAPGDTPTVAAARDGAVIQMFYTVNRYHDTLYQLGFTEQAFNFQTDNFGRGGAGNDRVSSEGQDSSGSNNANFSTPADGGAGRMQMYVFTGSNPDRDGTTDVDIIVHELTHGTSNRLHGNATGLGSQMSGGMGEGWGDWYGHVLTSEASDPINGVYTTGGYVLLNTFGLGSTNYYYGIRRFPKAVYSFTGGPSNRPHNPLTFADLNAGCVINDGAYAAAGGGACDQVHNAGEIWSSLLWEVRSKLVTRLGFQTGTQTALQVVTDGMKLAPLNPTFVQERDAIIAAARANANSSDNSADVADVWEGFRIRGMGFGASVQATSPAQVTEAFDSPNAVLAAGFSVSDSLGDGDGFPEPGEQLILTIPVVNTTGATITGVNVNVNGLGGASYGDVADGATVSRQIQFFVPSNTPCGSSIQLNINITGSAGPRTEIRNIIIGQPTPPVIENFDAAAVPALPAGWTSAQTGPGLAFVTKTGTADTAPNSAFTPNRGLAGGSSGATLDSADFAINSTAAVVSFRNNFNTEDAWDGGVLELSIGGGAFQDIITAGGSFIEGGYTGTLGANSNPLDGRAAWTGSSNGYITTRAQLPASANGQNVKFRWRFGEDTNTVAPSGVPGWNVDSVQVFTGYTCSVTPQSSAKFDFDGDSKTDISIFRPSLGEWWYLRSSDLGNRAYQFGASSDQIVPADYTGDGKTDIAFFRPSNGEWFILRSEDNSFYSFPFGTNGDIPTPGDFDGDGKADPAIFRPSNATWFILNSGGGTTIQTFGANGDKPTVDDFDGDGKDDLAIYRPASSQWWQFRSTQGVVALQFGSAGDKTVAADYTGDGKADVAFFRPSTGFWFVLRSEDSSFYSFPFGTNGDSPVPGDYDGDGRTDPAVFRPSNNTWFKQQSTSGFEAITFGIANDLPVPGAFVVQ